MGLDVNDIVIMAVSFFLVAILAPIALGEVFSANVTGWGTPVTTIFQTVLPILWMIGIAIAYIPKIRK